MRKLTSHQLAYLLFRVTLGINFLGHGLVRLPKINGFREWITGTFQYSILPPVLTSVFATALPFLEFALGLCLIFGILTRQTLIAGAVMMAFLILGSCLIEKWEFVGFQMIYAISFFILLTHLENNTFYLRRS